MYISAGLDFQFPAEFFACQRKIARRNLGSGIFCGKIPDALLAERSQANDFECLSEIGCIVLTVSEIQVRGTAGFQQHCPVIGIVLHCADGIEQACLGESLPRLEEDLHRVQLGCVLEKLRDGGGFCGDAGAEDIAVLIDYQCGVVGCRRRAP